MAINHVTYWSRVNALRQLLGKSGINEEAQELMPLPVITPYTKLENIVPTAAILNKIRGKRGVEIIKTYQFSYHRKNTHCMFNAIDFALKDSDLVKPEASLNCLKELAGEIEAGKYDNEIMWKGDVILVTAAMMGIVVADDHIHIDTRGLFGQTAPYRAVKSGVILQEQEDGF